MPKKIALLLFFLIVGCIEKNQKDAVGLSEERIVFSSNRDTGGEYNYDAPLQIYSMKIDGTDVRRLTHNNFNDDLPYFSPDGSKIVFDRYDKNSSLGEDSKEIYVMNTDGTGETRLTHNNVLDGHARWSPDGRRLVFVSLRSGKSPEIYTMDTNGNNVVQLTDNDLWDCDPDYAPDGRIVFTSSRALPYNKDPYDEHNYEVYIMNPDGTEVQRLTNDIYCDTGPHISPDSSKITYLRKVNWEENEGLGKWELVVMDIDGNNPRVIRIPDHVDPSTSYWDAHWSPEGNKLITCLMRYPDVNWNIYITDPQGTNWIRLTENIRIGDFCPAWGRVNGNKKITEEDIISGIGVVKFIDLEGGFYGIIKDDGEYYLPINLSQEFQIDGLRVHFEAKIRKDIASIQMWGRLIEILKMEKLD